MWRVPIGCNSNRPPQEAVGGYNKEARGEKLATHSKAVLKKIAKVESLPDPPELEKGVFAMLKKLSEDKP
jgi:hypothetical protein